MIKNSVGCIVIDIPDIGPRMVADWSGTYLLLKLTFQSGFSIKWTKYLFSIKLGENTGIHE